MARFFLAVLKVFLFLVLIAIAGLGAFLVVRHFGWPWWVGAAILVGLFGLIAGALFLKRWFLRRREEKFVRRVIEHDELAIQKAPIQERQHMLDLQERWKEAVEILRNSHLRKLGNPLYVLPWYMVFGESGSGKSTAVQSARLPSPVTSVGPAKGISGTRNCDWWFFDNAVVLDTAGRYAIPIDEGRDQDEWRKFLALLCKYRKREPLNGLIITIAADKIAACDKDALTKEGLSIRSRIDELMRVLGARFPIYVLVTKMDKILGMTSCSDFLPESALNQAMGWNNVSLRYGPEEIVDDAMASVSDRLKDLRLLLIHRHECPDPGIVAFPGEIERLRPGLLSFIQGAFEENPYQETPLLRGIYFSSGKQEGAPQSQLLECLSGFHGCEDRLPRTDRGLFLHDLFARVLPADRNLFQPLREFIKWRRLTKSMGLASWVALVLCVCGILSLSFIKNRQVIEDFTENFDRVPVLSYNLEKDLVLMDLYRQELNNMIHLNQHWLVPRMGLEQSMRVEGKLLNDYCKLFREGLLKPLDRALEKRMSSFSSNTNAKVVGDNIEQLVRRINLLTAAISGKKSAELIEMNRISGEALCDIDSKLMPEVAEIFNDIYVSDLLWEENKLTLENELSKLRTWLVHLTELKGSNLNWLVELTNNQPDIKPVTLDQFWGAEHLLAFEKIQIPPAFTPKGREHINMMLTQIEASLQNPKVLQSRRVEFEKWYSKVYAGAWEKFCMAFDEGRMHLAGLQDWRELAKAMTTPENPYFALLNLMTEDLKPIAGKQGTPSWVAQIMRFRNARYEIDNKKQAKAKDILSKAATEGERILQEIHKPDSIPALKEMESILSAADELQAYEDSLDKILPVTTSADLAYKMASDFFSSDINPKEGESPFLSARNHLIKLRGFLSSRRTDDEVLWRLLSGPLSFLNDYTIAETLCDLQAQWESEVLAKIQDMPDEKLRTALFEQSQGIVWKFVDSSAAPFLSRNQYGYFPREVWGRRFPLSTGFISFLNTGSVQTHRALPEYWVSAKALPTDVNLGVRLEPYATSLELNCGDTTQRLDNYNYPSNLRFNWQPDKCGDVTLQIYFPNLTLTKVYPGTGGFPGFLQDFAGGVKRLTPEDFPDQRQDLVNFGIEEIMVRYEFSGSEPITKLLMSHSFNVPRIICECWGELQKKVHESNLSSPEEPVQITEQPAKGEKPTVKPTRHSAPEGAPKKSPTRAGKGTGFFTLNAASLQDPKAADKLTRSLQEKGYKARIKTSKSASGAITYQVLVGSFQTQKEAKEAASQLKSEEQMQGRAVRMEREQVSPDQNQY